MEFVVVNSKSILTFTNMSKANLYVRLERVFVVVFLSLILKKLLFLSKRVKYNSEYELGFAEEYLHSLYQYLFCDLKGKLFKNMF